MVNLSLTHSVLHISPCAHSSGQPFSEVLISAVSSSPQRMAPYHN